MSATTLIAIVGLSLSAFAVGWNCYRDLTAKGKLSITCNIGFIVYPNNSIDKNKLFFQIVNIGRAPILAKSIGGRNKDGTYFYLQPRNKLPMMLKPGETFDEFTDDLTIASDKTDYICVYDTLGEVFKVSKKNMKYLRQQYKDMKK